MLNRRSFLMTSASASAGCALPRGLLAAEAARSLVTPNPAQQAWHDMELGMFFHFDIPVYKQGWNWRSFADFPDPNLYQPKRLDTDQWMEAAKAVGHKRIQQFARTEVAKLRFRATASVAEPHLRQFAAFRVD